jgi:hypothetical protein
MSDLQWPDKDPSDVWDFTLDASSWMTAVADTLATVGAAVTPSGLTISSTAVDPTGKATVRLSNGAAGVRYAVTLTLTSAGGRVLQRTVDILVREQ